MNNNRKVRISNYVVNKKQNMKERTLYNEDKCDFNKLFNIIEYPYRRLYLGESSLKITLDKLFELEPIIRNEKWNIPNGKIVSIIPNFKQLYYLLDIVITSVTDHWIHDQIIDYYSEEARVKSPGYGERYSSYDYWTNKNLHDRWIKINTNLYTLKDIREMLYENIQEARLAYTSISKSLYAVLMDFNNKETYKILDIAAYGERAIAASSFGNVSIYDGIDPNYDLIKGHTMLSMDLEVLNPDCIIRFLHIGIEDFKTNRKYDIITYSPPPFNTEPYAKSSNMNNTQTYSKYPTYEEYICCFLFEIIYKARCFSNIGTIFSFTVLDRNPEVFPVKIKNKGYISDYLELIYTEMLLLITSCLGFQYIGAIGLAAGGKQAGVPWWTFKYIETVDPFYIQLLQEYYSLMSENIVSRLISNYHSINHSIHPLFEEYVTINETNMYSISFYLPKKTSVILELIRLQIQQYIVEVVSKLSGVRIEKIRVILGRYLMMKSINATYEKPWNSGLYLDPVFPIKYEEDIEIDQQVINYLIEQRVNSDIATDIVCNYKYWFTSYECKGLSGLYHTIANYIQTIPLSNVEINIENMNNITVIKGNDIAVNILRSIPKGYKTCGISNELWKGKPDVSLLAYLRYETLGAHGHQYTRPVEKTAAIEELFGMPIIDIYASLYNNQSKQYCSIYPDVEENSIGSAFCLKMIEGAYLANPVDVPIFIKKALHIIIKDLHNAKQNNKRLMISMNFTVWIDVEFDFVDKFINGTHYSELFKRSKNIGLNILSNSEFVTAVYILDKTKYPSVLLDKVTNRDNTLSIGVILESNSIKDKKDAIYKLVKDKQYVQII